MPTHITARLAWHNNGWDGSVCKAPEKNTYCVGCRSFPGDVIARDRDLEVEKRLAGRAGAQLEGYVPPCSYSYNAFGPNEAQAASNPPDFFFGGAGRHEWTLPAATVCVWPYEAMYAEEVKASGYLDNDRRRALTLEFFEPIRRDCGNNLVFYYANYSNPLTDEEAARYVLIGVSRIVNVGGELFYENVSDEIAKRYAGGMIWARNITSSFPDEGLRLLGVSPSAESLKSVMGHRDDAGSIVAALYELGQLGVKGPAAATWLRTITVIAARTPKPDLVWSGPEVPGLYARDTRRVYEELFGSAERSIWASTFAFFDGPKAFEILARRMEAKPILHVTLLLNIQRKRGDNSAAEQLVRRFADRFWKTDWPGSSRPNVFYDPRALDLDGPGGVLHAKAVVADDEAVFVTSANLTEAALDRNIELGVLIRDRAFALTISGYFRNLIDRNVLKPLPLS
jgi:PLD-like domain